MDVCRCFCAPERREREERGIILVKEEEERTALYCGSVWAVAALLWLLLQRPGKFKVLVVDAGCPYKMHKNKIKLMLAKKLQSGEFLI